MARQATRIDNHHDSRAFSDLRLADAVTAALGEHPVDEALTR